VKDATTPAIGAFWWACGLMWWLSSCLPANVCGPGQVQTPAGYCACAPGHAPEASGKPFCVAVPSAVGRACSESKPCDVLPYDRCQPAATGGEGYCTTAGCTTSADCPSGYACDRASTPSYCRRPPVGQGKACTANGDCAGQEAGLCGSPYLNQCLVEGCTVSPNNCHEGWTCCDLTGLGLAKSLCLPVTSCPGA
jgi:hypothetical protein